MPPRIPKPPTKIRRSHNQAIDVASIARAVSRPGIDPRTWVSLATVQQFAVDSAHGVFADIKLFPTGLVTTARVGAAYAGKGFGLYAPLSPGDEVVVIAPNGDPNAGLVIVTTLWSAAAPPPTEASDDDMIENVILRVEDSRTLRMVVSGGGSVVVEAQNAGDVVLRVGAGKVYVGDDEDSEPIAKGTVTKTWMTSAKSTFDGHYHIAPVGGGPTTGPLSVPTPTFPAPIPGQAAVSFPEPGDIEAEKGQVV